MEQTKLDDLLLRGFLLALHGMTLALEVGNVCSPERYWEMVRNLLRTTLPYFTREGYQIERAISAPAEGAALPDEFVAAWLAQVGRDREDAARLLDALRLPIRPDR